MNSAINEHEARLVPASDEEIIGLAVKMWAEPAMKAIFGRVGYDKDLTEAEEKAISAAVDAYRQGELWNRDPLHMALAPCLLRQLVAKKIDDLNDPKAIAFLSRRKVIRSGQMIKVEHPSLNEVLKLAQAMRSDPKIWAILQRIKVSDAATEEECDLIDAFVLKYKKKYGLFNQSSVGTSTAISLLRELSAGNIDRFDDPRAKEIMLRSPFLSE